MHLSERDPRETGREYALRTIKDNIIRLELAPGSMVSENELAAELGLSRTPIREALIDLSKVKIVEIYPQRGSAVALVDYAMVEEARFMRYVLERAVVELNCEIASCEDLRRLSEIVNLHAFYIEQHRDPDSLFQIDNQFHRTLFQIARKGQVYNLMQNIAIHFDRVRRMSLVAVKDTKILEDHQAILDALIRRDAKAASDLMDRHLTRYKIDEKQIRERYPDYFK